MSYGILIFNFVGPILYYFVTKLKFGKKYQNIFLLLVFIHIVVFYTCFKYETLPDIAWYNEYFVFLETNSVNTLIDLYNLNYEFGFYYIVKFSTYIFDDVRGFYFIRGVIVAGCNVYFVKKYSQYSVFLAILFFFMLVGGEQSVFVVRQYLAMSIYLLAIDSIINHNQLRYLFWALLAFSIHNTAIVFLPFYYLYWMNVNKDNYYRIITYVVVIAVLAKFTSAFLFSFINLYQQYTLDHDPERQASSGPFLRSLVMLLPYLYFCKYKYLDDSVGRLVFWILICTAFISFMIIGIPTGDRMYKNFCNLSIIAVPYVASKISKRNIRLIYIFSMVTFFAFLYFNTGYSYGYYFSLD